MNKIDIVFKNIELETKITGFKPSKNIKNWHKNQYTSDEGYPKSGLRFPDKNNIVSLLNSNYLISLGGA